MGLLISLIGFLPTILRVFGFIEQAEALIEKIEVRKKAQEVANAPTTKQERTDAANKGDL
jgi:hypothetical protein